jgi:hypothetical protein
MQSALYHVVSEIVTGRCAPPEWDGAVVKLPPKRAGEEHILESNRPICLMSTVMKLVTCLDTQAVQIRIESWTFRILTGRESVGTVHQTTNRPTTVEFGRSESPTEFSLCCLFRHGKLLQCPQSTGSVLSILEKRFAHHRRHNKYVGTIRDNTHILSMGSRKHKSQQIGDCWL